MFVVRREFLEVKECLLPRQFIPGLSLSVFEQYIEDIEQRSPVRVQAVKGPHLDKRFHHTSVYLGQGEASEE